MTNTETSSTNEIKAPSRRSSTTHRGTNVPANRYLVRSVEALLKALDVIADSVDALPLGDSQRRLLVQLQRATKAAVDAVLTGDATELARLEATGLKSVRVLEARHRERFTLTDCPAPCVPLDPFGFAGRVHALGDPVIGSQPTTLENADRALASIRAMNEADELDDDSFASMFPWIALNLHEARVNAGLSPLLPEHVANRSPASHSPRSKDGKHHSKWPEYETLKRRFEFWKEEYPGAKLGDAAYQSLIVDALKALGASESSRKGLFKAQAVRRYRSKSKKAKPAFRPAASG